MSIRYKGKDAAAIITLNRWEKPNALTLEISKVLGTYF
jgi:hypothetical protein